MAYCIIIEGKSWLEGKPSKTQRVGPFGSEDEAEHAKTGCLPWEDDGYVYHVHIEAEANEGS
jgi:hypothetical protein